MSEGVFRMCVNGPRVCLLLGPRVCSGCAVADLQSAFYRVLGCVPDVCSLTYRVAGIEA